MVICVIYCRHLPLYLICGGASHQIQPHFPLMSPWGCTCTPCTPWLRLCSIHITHTDTHCCAKWIYPFFVFFCFKITVKPRSVLISFGLQLPKWTFHRLLMLYFVLKSKNTLNTRCHIALSSRTARWRTAHRASENVDTRLITLNMSLSNFHNLNAVKSSDGRVTSGDIFYR